VSTNILQSLARLQSPLGDSLKATMKHYTDVGTSRYELECSTRAFQTLLIVYLGQATTQSRQSAKLFSSRRNWDSPNPSPSGECAPPLVPGGGAHLLAIGGVGESQNSDEGTYCTLWYSVYIYNIYC
jgi:hypothetical protein